MRKINYWIIYKILCPATYLFLIFYRYLSGCHCASRENDVEFQGRGQGIYVCFHSNLLYAIMVYRETYKYGLVGTVELSASRDGQIITLIAQMLGLRIVRGSARKGRRITSIRHLMREIKEGWSLCVALDGPRGPRGKVSSATLNLARASGLPIVPMYGRSRSEWRLKTWDRFRIPKPFSNARVYYGKPIYIPEEASKEDLEKIKDHLRQEMGELD